MEGTNNAGNRGAYAPVTVAIAPGDENIVPPKTQTKKKGVCASLSRMQLLILIVLIIVIVIVIIIIIAVVVSSKKEKLAAATAGPNVTQPMMTTTTPAPPTTTPTPGPPVPGSFNGYMVLDLPYKDSYDDVRDSERAQLVASFTTAVNELYTNTTVYQGVTVSALLKTTSAKVQVEFEISVSDISKGARLILVEALSPLRSELNTYTVLEKAINPEKATGTGQETDG